MNDKQVIYPVLRLLANPRLFRAIANLFEGPEWDVFAGAFYDLLEAEFMEDADVDPEFSSPEVCFREKPDMPDTYQVIMAGGNAIELRPLSSSSGENVVYAAVQTEDDLGAVTAIYGRLVRALEDERPDLKGDIALCEPPTPSNGFLRDDNGDAFRGMFHLLSDPESQYTFVVDVVDVAGEEWNLKATIKPI